MIFFYISFYLLIEKNKVEINETAFDAVPDDRREAINDTFENAPEGIKSTINDFYQINKERYNSKIWNENYVYNRNNI